MSEPASQVYNRMRGFDPWPGIFTTFRGKRLQLCDARPDEARNSPAGRLAFEEGKLFVGCGAGRLELLEVRLEGKKRTAAADFARGYRITSEEELGR